MSSKLVKCICAQPTAAILLQPTAALQLWKVQPNTTCTQECISLTQPQFNATTHIMLHEAAGLEPPSCDVTKDCTPLPANKARRQCRPTPGSHGHLSMFLLTECAASGRFMHAHAA